MIIFEEPRYKNGKLKWQAIRLFRDKQREGLNDNQILIWALDNQDMSNEHCVCRMMVDLIYWGKL